MNRIIQVFRTGTHTDGAGVSRTFTSEQLREIADRFDPNVGAVPLVKGHPATDDPAYGWVERFMFEETSGVLYAVPKDVDAGFQNEVRAKRYSRISIALFSPTSPNNPVPGMFYPKHIGFLGAATPAVSGLKAANFNDKPDEVLMFDLNDESQVSKFAEVMEKVFRKLGFKNDAASPAPGDPAPDPKATTEYKELETKLGTLESERDELKKTTDQLAADKARAEISAYCDGLVTAGKITPVEAGRLTEVMFAMRDNTDELQFSEGEGDKAQTVKGSPTAILKGILDALPQRIHFSELSGSDDDGVSGIVFTSPEQREVQGGARMDLHRRALAYSQKNGVSYLDAVSIIERGSH